jgi:hypothetical protein
MCCGNLHNASRTANCKYLPLDWQEQGTAMTFTLSWFRAFAVCFRSINPCASASRTGTLLVSALARSSSWPMLASMSGFRLVAIKV